MPNNNILHSNSVAFDTWFATHNSWVDFDVLIYDWNDHRLF